MQSTKYNLQNYQCPTTLNQLLHSFEYATGEDEQPSVTDNLHTLLHSQSALADYWFSICREAVWALDRKYPSRQDRHIKDEHFRGLFSEDLIAFTLLHSEKYTAMEFMQQIERVYPQLSLIGAIKETSWQAFMEAMPGHIKATIYKRLTTLPQPFEDGRFQVVPLHTNAFKRGQCHSVWLRDIDGHYQTLWDDATQSRYVCKLEKASDNFFLDAKLGILFVFQGRPSITVSFQVDARGNVFIHQVQAKLRDRGHYKLGSHWRERVIDYMRAVFPSSKLYLVDGQQAALDAWKSYTKKAPDGLRPTPDEQERIATNYNQWPGLSVRRRVKAGNTYRQLHAT